MNKPITNYTTNSKLCSVRAWQFMINKLYSQYGSNHPITVNNFRSNPICVKDIKFQIRYRAAYEAKANLTVISDSFGTHSVRYVAVLLLYLSGNSIINIMLQGQQSSDVFMIYIKWSILERLEGIASCIILIDSLTPILY